MENQLILDYLNGKEEALEALINQYLKEVYLYFLKRTNNVVVAEDLTQETFIKMWRNLKKFDLNKNFRTWLFTIAKNIFIDYLKKHYQRNGLKKEEVFSFFDSQSEDGVKILESIADNLPLAFEQLEQKEDQKKLNAIIKKLPSSQQLLLQLRLEEGLSFKELSEKFNTSINTIKARYYRLINKIRENF